LIRSGFCLVLAATAFCPAILSSGQTTSPAATGSVAGKLTSTGGAAVAGAAVTCANLAPEQVAGTSRQALTDKNGAYGFSQLAPGSYTLRFSAVGYATVEVRGVAVKAGEAVQIDQSLTAGSTAEVKVVEWQAQELTTTQEAGAKIAVKDIPLATRNYTQAAGMDAGVSSQVSNATNIGINTMSVQVGASSTTNYEMDGAPVASSTMTPVTPGVPNPDGIAENKVESWSYAAGPERYSGANIRVTTKSGSDAFHGTLFEFVRNDLFNSNNFFRKREGLSMPVLKQNQFGLALGGPLWRKKLYIFGSYQGTRQSNGFDSAGFSSVSLPPLPNSRTATDIGTMYCGETGSFGGVAIACDGSNINQVALDILNLRLANGSYLIPGSNDSYLQHLSYSIPAKFQEDQLLINTDYAVTGKEKVAERIFFTRDPLHSNFTGMGSLPGAPTDSLEGNVDAVVSLTSTLGAGLENTIRASGQHYLATDTPQIPFTEGPNGNVNIAPVVSGINKMDILNISGLFSLNGNGNWDHHSANQYQLADQISWTRGRHSIHAGFEAERRQWNVHLYGYGIGELNMMTIADFLLGLPGCPPSASGCLCPPDSYCDPKNAQVNGVQTNGTPFSSIFSSSGPSSYAGVVTGSDGITHAYRYSDYSGYVQDDVKLAARLTVNAGVRWEFFSLPSDATGNFTNFWPSLTQRWSAAPSSEPYQGYVVPANFKGMLPPGVYRNTRNTPLPIGAPLTNFAPRLGFAWQPLGRSGLVVRGGYGIFYDRVDSNLLEGDSAASVPYATPVGGSGQANWQATLAQPYQQAALGWGLDRNTALSTGSLLTLRSLDEGLAVPKTQKWNLEIQKQLPFNLIADVGYAGAHSIHLQNGDREINEAQLASPSSPINGQKDNTTENAGLRVPYLGIAPNGLDDQQTDASAKYNSLLASIRKQMSHGVQVQASYAFRKTLSTMAAFGFPSMDSNDPLDARQQYGPGTAPWRLAVNYSWDLPYKGEGARGTILGDWGVSGMTIIQAGNPMTVTDSLGGTIYGNAGTSRAQFCSGMGARNAGASGSVKSRLDGYFNEAAFADTNWTTKNDQACTLPQIGDGYGYGNSGVGILLGPGQDNTDLSVNKHFAVREAKVELRMEMFNAFNHAQFNNPDTNLPDPTFGQITSTSVNPRLIQFALKFSY
jgi:hypothetical protein